jgi:hypothetical protein
VAELFEADPASLFAQAHEALVAATSPGLSRATSARIAAGSPEQSKVEPSAKRKSVEGRQGHQLDVVGQPPPAERPKLLEQEGRGDDGRARVEGEAVLPMHARASARRVQTLQHRHPVATRAEPDCRGEAAEPAADHDGMRPRVRPSCNGGARRRRPHCQRLHTALV